MNDFADIANIFQRISKLSPDRLKALEILLLGETQNNTKELLGDYYDELSVLEDEDAIINYPALPEIIKDFSWVLIGEKSSKSAEIARIAREAMRKIAWRKIDFSTCQKVLDVGCGHGTDVVELARKYEQLETCGYSISKKQVEIGNHKIKKFNLQDRSQILHRDSSKDEFPDYYDLVYGFEVICHIPNKQGLFDNIDRHLNEKGHLVFADMISNASFSIDYDAHSSYLITKPEWLDLLSNHNLKVVSYVDISHEVGNGLYDPNVQENIDYVCKLNNLNENAKIGIESYINLYKLLRKGLLSYVIVTAQKQQDLTAKELYTFNQQKLDAPLKYSEVSLQQLFYNIEWQPQVEENLLLSSVENGNGSTKSGKWLILSDRHGVGEKLKKSIEKRGDSCLLVYPGETNQQKETGIQDLNPSEPQAFETLFPDTIATNQDSWKGIIHLWSLDAPASAELTETTLKNSQKLGCTSVLHLLQVMLKYSSSISLPKLWLVTKGVQSISPEDNNLAIAQSPLWGFGRVVSLEHPNLWGGLIDLDPEAFDEEQLLQQILDRNNNEDQIAFRSGKTYVARLKKEMLPESEAVSFDGEGTYLITGGLGALGLRTAQWMLEKGAKSLVLVSRSKPSTEKQNAIARLQEQGASVIVVQTDICDHQGLEKLLQNIEVSASPLKGIIHLAGISGGIQPIEQMNQSELETVIAPKVIGGWNLHQLTQNQKLDIFVCFSSISTVWGSAGQSHYAAANHFLDSLVHYRQAMGLPSFSINWAAWSGGGMASDEGLQELSKRGVYSISPEEGIGALEQLWNSGRVQTTVAQMDWNLFKELYNVGRPRLLLEQIGLQSPKEDEGSYVEAKSEILTELQNAPLRNRKKILTQYIQREIGKLLKFPTTQLPELHLGFFEMGMDSLMAVELRNQLSSGLSCPISAATLFDSSNIKDLAEFILQEFFSAESSVTETLSNDIDSQIENLSGNELEDEIAEELKDIESLLGE